MSTQLSGNTTFYQKAAASTLGFRDIFRDVFKKRQKGDGARQFMAGTALSTPAPDEMLLSWQRPWIFARVGLLGVAFIVILTVSAFFFIDQEAAVTTFGAAVVPIAVLLFFWEMNIPRNIPIYEVLAVFFIGGAFSFICLRIFYPLEGGGPAWTAPFAEEPAKLAAMLPFLIHKSRKGRVYIFTGLLIGAAVGAGFEVVESAGYNMSFWMDAGPFWGLYVMALRCFPNAHTMWAALYGGALAWVMDGRKFHVKHLVRARFLLFFGATVVVHALNNGVIEYFIPALRDIINAGFALPKMAVLTAACWLLMLPLLRRAIQQILRVVDDSTVAWHARKAPGYILYGITGVYAGQAVELPVGRVALGRDPGSCNLLFPADTRGISRRHCTVAFDGGAVTVTDDGSSQGTFLDGRRRLEQGQAVALQAGQRFSLAGNGAVFELRRQ